MKRYIVIKPIKDKSGEIIDVEILGVFKTRKQAELYHFLGTAIKEIIV